MPAIHDILPAYVCNVNDIWLSEALFTEVVS